MLLHRKEFLWSHALKLLFLVLASFVLIDYFLIVMSEEECRGSMLSSSINAVNTYVKDFNFTEFSNEFDCQSTTWCDTYYNDTEEVQNYIHKHQNPVDCSTARFMVVSDHYMSGMGSALHVALAYFTVALNENRVYLMTDDIYFEYGKLCEPATWDCLFLPVSHCRTSLHAQDWEHAPNFTKAGDHPDVRVVRLNSIRANEPYVASPLDYYEIRQWKLAKYKHKDLWWWQAQYMKYALRPSEKIKNLVAQQQKKIFPNGVMPHPIISMYVRHGDKHREATLIPFPEYMNLITPVAQRHNIKDIYLGTDDPDVILDAVTNYTNFNFYYIHSARVNGAPMSNLRNDTYYKEFLTQSIVDLFVQVQGDVFVGTYTSNWCRLIDELRKPSGKAGIPYFTPETNDHLFILQ